MAEYPLLSRSYHQGLKSIFLTNSPTEYFGGILANKCRRSSAASISTSSTYKPAIKEIFPPRFSSHLLAVSISAVPGIIHESFDGLSGCYYNPYSISV